MVSSMTGFATHTATINFPPHHLSLVISVKSLNARFFECSTRLPSILQSLETAIIRDCKKRLIRGSITVTVQLDMPHLAHKTLRLVPGALEAYVETAQDIAKKYGLHEQLSLNSLLALPGMFTPIDTILDESISAAIFDEIAKGIKNLAKDRLREGKALEQDLCALVSQLETLAAEVATRVELSLESRKKMLADQLVLAAQPVEKLVLDSIYQIIQQQIDRLDVHEETVRFRMHLGHLKNILESGESEKGKRIDFTLQELLREISTISAKSCDATVSTLVIEIKTVLEKLREQTHNIV